MKFMGNAIKMVAESKRNSSKPFTQLGFYMDNVYYKSKKK